MELGGRHRRGPDSGIRLLLMGGQPHALRQVSVPDERICLLVLFTQVKVAQHVFPAYTT